MVHAFGGSTPANNSHLHVREVQWPLLQQLTPRGRVVSVKLWLRGPVMRVFFAVYNPPNQVTQHADMRTSEGIQCTAFPALIASSRQAAEVASAASCSSEVTSGSMFLRHAGKSHLMVVKKIINSCPEYSLDRMEVLTLAAVVLQEVS
ncbi:hypothetical protein MRX96_049950 [Rhipicephalus microplus]